VPKGGQGATGKPYPALAARLRALGEKSELPAPLTQTAADKYLGHRLIALAQSVGLIVEHRRDTAAQSPIKLL